MPSSARSQWRHYYMEYLLACPKLIPKNAIQSNSQKRALAAQNNGGI
jgi:hypothetical protein